MTTVPSNPTRLPAMPSWPDPNAAAMPAPVLDTDDAALRKFQKELSAGLVSLALLALLTRSPEPLYGYQIAKALERMDGVLSGKQSALYPVLRNLESAGLLASHVEPSASGPPRRYYRITEPGRRACTAWASAWTASRTSLDRLLSGDSP